MRALKRTLVKTAISLLSKVCPSSPLVASTWPRAASPAPPEESVGPQRARPCPRWVPQPSPASCLCSWGRSASGGTGSRAVRLSKPSRCHRPGKEESFPTTRSQILSWRVSLTYVYVSLIRVLPAPLPVRVYIKWLASTLQPRPLSGMLTCLETPLTFATSPSHKLTRSFPSWFLKKKKKKKKKKEVI